MILGGELAYHDYEGIALDLGERPRLVADLGDKSACCCATTERSPSDPRSRRLS